MGNENGSSQGMPDFFGRQLALLHDLPDVVKTKPSTIQHVPTLGVGGEQVFVVQTIRQRERGDTIFLRVMGQDGVNADRDSAEGCQRDCAAA